jgi:hypothetical protein
VSSELLRGKTGREHPVSELNQKPAATHCGWQSEPNALCTTAVGIQTDTPSQKYIIACQFTGGIHPWKEAYLEIHESACV